jgi:peptidoglycan/xylan/chitin deacetylase (PgdA/CDA1 family)/uncharacterized membrane protein YkvA (DUF1232 family)
MQIGLKVDVDTLRGTREGTPALVRLLERRAIPAAFLFSVGPDHTGRALRRLCKPGFLAKVVRTSVPSTYGLKTLAYGTLLPGPHIGCKAGDEMRAVRDAGFEVGLHSWDRVRWQDAVARKVPEWTCREWQRGIEDYVAALGESPTCCGAAGWQVDPTVLEFEGAAGLTWTSDTRGKTSFRPWINGRIRQCVELPTNLPTMDELIGRDGVSAENVGERLVDEVVQDRLTPRIFTLHAELEGGPLLARFERALEGWQAAGAEFHTLGTIAVSFDLASLPVAEVERGTLPGAPENWLSRAPRHRPTAPCWMRPIEAISRESRSIRELSTGSSMFSLFRIFRQKEWRQWSRRKKAMAIAILLALVLILALSPDMAVFAGILDASILDVFITLLGVQLFLYGEQLKSIALLAFHGGRRHVSSSDQ